MGNCWPNIQRLLQGDASTKLVAYLDLHNYFLHISRMAWHKRKHGAMHELKIVEIIPRYFTNLVLVFLSLLQTQNALPVRIFFGHGRRNIIRQVSPR
jgi:hypothetical protein